MAIIEFKNRKEKFNEWLQEIIKINFENQQINSALFIWELPPNIDGYQTTHCRFNCDLDQLKFFHRQLGEFIKEQEFDKYLTENIDKYIELI